MVHFEGTSYRAHTVRLQALCPCPYPLMRDAFRYRASPSLPKRAMFARAQKSWSLVAHG
jgi:hypothetical protein